MDSIIHVQKSKINHRYYFNNSNNFYSIFYSLYLWLKPASIFSKTRRSSSLLFTREKQKRAEASAASCAVDVSAPGGSCFQEYIDKYAIDQIQFDPCLQISKMYTEASDE